MLLKQRNQTKPVFKQVIKIQLDWRIFPIIVESKHKILFKIATIYFLYHIYLYLRYYDIMLQWMACQSYLFGRYLTKTEC